MLTSIVCIVALVGSSVPQRLTFQLTPIQVSELHHDFPAESLHAAVCSHLSHAVAMTAEE